MDSSQPAPAEPDQPFPRESEKAPADPSGRQFADKAASKSAPFLQSAPFVFHGDAHEYFQIWIVNTLLSLLTLGVFSAWATVRQRRYLRGNTEIFGHCFDYAADPWRILAGRASIVLVVLACAWFGAMHPAVRVAALGAGVALLPWIIVRSLAFNAQHTAWRGLRFQFQAGLGAAVQLYLFRALLVPLTLGFYYPAWMRACAKFRISRHRFGTAGFSCDVKNRPFYRAYLAAGAAFLVTAIMMGFAMLSINESNAGRPPTTFQLLPVLLVYAAVLHATRHYLFATLFNPLWNGTRLAGHRFHATLSTRRWSAIQLTNTLAIIGSCGLLYPWARIRSVRYALSCLEIQPAGPIDWITRAGSKAGNAVEAPAKFTGIDFDR